jgi:hypothetical protein
MAPPDDHPRPMNPKLWSALSHAENSSSDIRYRVQASSTVRAPSLTAATTAAFRRGVHRSASEAGSSWPPADRRRGLSAEMIAFLELLMFASRFPPAGNKSLI